MISALPALVALLAKLWIFWCYRHKLTQQNMENKCLLLFLASLAVHNIFEISGYIVDVVELRILLMDGWYTFAVISIAVAAVFASMIYSPKVGKYFGSVVLGFGFGLSLFIVFTDFVIISYKENGDAMTKIAGPYYVAYQLYALGACLSMLIFFTLGAFSADRVKRAKATSMLLGLLPFILVIIAVVIGQQLGGNISAGMFVPIAITFFLWVLTHNTSKDDVFNPFVFLPSSHASRKRQFVMNLLKVRQHPQPLKPQIRELEDILITDAMRHSQGVQKDAAEALGVSAATISNRLKAIRNSRRVRRAKS